MEAQYDSRAKQTGPSTLTLRQNVAQRLSAELENTAVRIEALTDCIINRLTPIVAISGPIDNRKEENKLEEVYPPLFTEYRNHLIRMNKALTIIEDVMSRVEV